MNRMLRCIFLMGVGTVGLTGELQAQIGIYPPRPVQPIYPGPVNPGYPGRPGSAYGYGYGYGYPGGGIGNSSYGAMTGYGNVLQGQAQLQSATSNSYVTMEEARILREKSNQEKIDTRKKSFDQMLYEKANTPTQLQEQTKLQTETLARVMTYPNRNEIADGRTLNIMLPFLQSLLTQGTLGQPVPLAQQNVLALNVTTSGATLSGSSSGSVGMLRNGGVVEWPPALLGPQQEKLDKLLPAAFEATASGKLTPKLLKQIRTEMKLMRDIMREQNAREELETSSYLRGIEFYNSLEASVNALERPDARKQLNGSIAARGRNVQELVDYMTENGLRFAPAAPGSESAYQATHDAFVRYARAAQSGGGFQASNFQASNAPIGTPLMKK